MLMQQGCGAGYSVKDYFFRIAVADCQIGTTWVIRSTDHIAAAKEYLSHILGADVRNKAVIDEAYLYYIDILSVHQISDLAMKYPPVECAVEDARLTFPTFELHPPVASLYGDDLLDEVYEVLIYDGHGGYGPISRLYVPAVNSTSAVILASVHGPWHDLRFREVSTFSLRCYGKLGEKNKVIRVPCEVQ